MLLALLLQLVQIEHFGTLREVTACFCCHLIRHFSCVQPLQQRLYVYTISIIRIQHSSRFAIEINADLATAFASILPVLQFAKFCKVLQLP